MSRKRLNPFEKEFLIRQFRENSNLKLSQFCEANGVTAQTFRKWMDQYDAAGIEGLSRGSRYSDLLPGSIDPTVENYKKEILRLTIENERLKKKLCSPDDARWADPNSTFRSDEFDIVRRLSRRYPVKDLCELMGVSRSGYYKHLHLEEAGNLRSEKLRYAVALVSETHRRHPSHGYRWVAAFIRRNTDYSFSDGLIYKAFRYLGITSETKHKKRCKPRRIKDKYPNLIFATWEKVDRPRQVIVSDMTAFHAGDRYYELTMYFDVFTKQILSWRLADRRGDREPYLFGLQDVLNLLEYEGAVREPVYLHTDQGSVYSSMAYNDLVQNTNIIRSMSRAGKPTDNPVNESLNGWIKEELFSDFHLDELTERYFVSCAIEEYIDYYNEQRPSYALGYDTPNDFYRRFINGEIPPKNTFESRFDGPLETMR